MAADAVAPPNNFLHKPKIDPRPYQALFPDAAINAAKFKAVLNWKNRQSKPGIYGNYASATGIAILPTIGSTLAFAEYDDPTLNAILLERVPRLTETFHHERGDHGSYAVRFPYPVAYDFVPYADGRKGERMSLRTGGGHYQIVDGQHFYQGEDRGWYPSGDYYINNGKPAITLTDAEANVLLSLIAELKPPKPVKKFSANSPTPTSYDQEWLLFHLPYIDPSRCRNNWIAIGGVIKDLFGDSGIEIFDSWSRNSAKYVDGEIERTVWKSLKSYGKATTKSISYYANEDSGNQAAREWFMHQRRMFTDVDKQSARAEIPHGAENRLEPISDISPIGDTPTIDSATGEIMAALPDWPDFDGEIPDLVAKYFRRFARPEVFTVFRDCIKAQARLAADEYPDFATWEALTGHRRTKFRSKQFRSLLRRNDLPISNSAGSDHNSSAPGRPVKIGLRFTDYVSCVDLLCNTVVKRDALKAVFPDADTIIDGFYLDEHNIDNADDVAQRINDAIPADKRAEIAAKMHQVEAAIESVRSEMLKATVTPVQEKPTRDRSLDAELIQRVYENNPGKRLSHRDINRLTGIPISAIPAAAEAADLHGVGVLYEKPISSLKEFRQHSKGQKPTAYIVTTPEGRETSYSAYQPRQREYVIKAIERGDHVLEKGVQATIWKKAHELTDADREELEQRATMSAKRAEYRARVKFEPSETKPLSWEQRRDVIRCADPAVRAVYPRELIPAEYEQPDPLAWVNEAIRAAGNVAPVEVVGTSEPLTEQPLVEAEPESKGETVAWIQPDEYAEYYGDPDEVDLDVESKPIEVPLDAATQKQADECPAPPAPPSPDLIEALRRAQIESISANLRAQGALNKETDDIFSLMARQAQRRTPEPETAGADVDALFKAANAYLKTWNTPPVVKSKVVAHVNGTSTPQPALIDIQENIA